jgi:hypothetical protein
MKLTAFLFSIPLALAAVACTGGGGRLPLSDDAQDEGEIRFIRNTTFDGQILSVKLVHGDESTTTLTTARNAVDNGKPFRLAMPDHSGWSWTFVNTAQDSTTYAYTAISWTNDDPTDYLAAGYWLHFPRASP